MAKFSITTVLAVSVPAVDAWWSRSREISNSECEKSRYWGWFWCCDAGFVAGDNGYGWYSRRRVNTCTCDGRTCCDTDNGFDLRNGDTTCTCDTANGFVPDDNGTTCQCLNGNSGEGQTCCDTGFVLDTDLTTCTLDTAEGFADNNGTRTCDTAKGFVSDDTDATTCKCDADGYDAFTTDPDGGAGGDEICLKYGWGTGTDAHFYTPDINGPYYIVVDDTATGVREIYGGSVLDLTYYPRN